MIKLLRFIIGVASLLGFLLVLSSCGILSGTTTRDSDLFFDELQKEVPFTIIVPSYLPKDISPYPSGYLLPEKNPSYENPVMIGFGYSNRSESKFIDITQENGEVTFHSSRPSSVYFEIGGTSILEEETEVYAPSISLSDSGLLHGIYYGWSHNGVSFTLSIFGYVTYEGIKIVVTILE
jgi:hypothetical protein